MKPATFDELPGKLRESLLWDIDLSYDSYESSKAETIYNLMWGCPDHTNEERIKSAYERMDEEMLLSRARSLHEEAVREIESLKLFLDIL